MADAQQQLATLLGRDVKQLRKTDEQPPRISIIDVAALITGKDKNQAAEDFRRITARYPDVKANCFDVKFRDSRGRRGQKETPVTDVRGMGLSLSLSLKLKFKPKPKPPVKLGFFQHQLPRVNIAGGYRVSPVKLKYPVKLKQKCSVRALESGREAPFRWPRRGHLNRFRPSP